jgi:hypothetical protein
MAQGSVMGPHQQALVILPAAARNMRGEDMTHWRQKPRPKSPRPVTDILRQRNERTTAVLIACITQMSSSHGPDSVTHTLVAERTGLPLQYVRWKYPSRENLMSLADA